MFFLELLSFLKQPGAFDVGFEDYFKCWDFFCYYFLFAVENVDVRWDVECPGGDVAEESRLSMTAK